MPSRNFDKFLLDHKLIHTEKIQFLSNTKIGIDASVWLRSAQKIINSQQNELTAYLNPPTLPGVDAPVSNRTTDSIMALGEPFQQAMGGVPLTLRSILERDLRMLQSCGITPYFVFNGLGLIKSEQPFANFTYKKFTKKNLMWNEYYAGRFEPCMDQWRSSANYTGIDVVNMMIRVLFENKVDYFRAPFLAAPQLLYLELSKFVHFIYCSHEVIVYDAGQGKVDKVERVIVGMDFEKGTFDWIDKYEILQKCGLENQQLLDAYILAGFDQYPTFGPIQNNPSPFEEASRLVADHKSALNVIREYKSAQMTATVEFYYKANAIFRCHPIINEQCIMEPIDSEIDFPADLGEIFGPRFNDSVYFFLSQGLISPQVLNNVTSRLILEFPPACQGESTQYRNFLNDVTDLRTDTLALLASALGETYEVQVSTSYWFDHEKSFPMEIEKSDLPLILSWKVPLEIFTQPMRADMVNALRILNNPQLREMTIVQNDLIYHSEFLQILYLVHFQVLEARGFVDADHVPTLVGEILAKSRPEHQEELFLAIELLRYNALNGDQYEFLDGLKNRDSSPVLLLTRVFSMINPRLKGVPWSGIVDLELLCFNSILKTLVRSLRNLTEMTILHSYLKEESILENENYPRDFLALKKMYFSLPFGHENNCALGLVLKYHLQHYKDAGYNTSLLKTKFPACYDPLEDLKRGTNFWESVVEAAKVMSDAGIISPETYQQFLNADALLTQSLQ